MDGDMSVPSWLTKQIDASGVSQIRSAVAEAEKKTSAEIVPMVVRSAAVSGPILHWLLPRGVKQKLALIRAELEFHRLNLRNTLDRTGILIFVSLDDHEAVVLADRAISQKLPSETWMGLIEILLTGIKSKNMVKGYCDAIHLSGEILAKFFPPSTSNPNEISDRFVIRE